MKKRIVTVLLSAIAVAPALTGISSASAAPTTDAAPPVSVKSVVTLKVTALRGSLNKRQDGVVRTKLTSSKRGMRTCTVDAVLNGDVQQEQTLSVGRHASTWFTGLQVGKWQFVSRCDAGGGTSSDRAHLRRLTQPLWFPEVRGKFACDPEHGYASFDVTYENHLSTGATHYHMRYLGTRQDPQKVAGSSSYRTGIDGIWGAHRKIVVIARQGQKQQRWVKYSPDCS